MGFRHESFDSLGAWDFRLGICLRAQVVHLTVIGDLKVQLREQRRVMFLWALESDCLLDQQCKVLVGMVLADKVPARKNFVEVPADMGVAPLKAVLQFAAAKVADLDVLGMVDQRSDHAVCLRMDLVGL